MRKGLTEVVFILDRSGSMSGLEADTIGGFNSMINKQKKEDGEGDEDKEGKEGEEDNGSESDESDDIDSEMLGDVQPESSETAQL